MTIRVGFWLGRLIFLVFDKDRGLELLGGGPSYEYMFEVNDGKLNSRFEEVGGSGYGDEKGKWEGIY